MNQALRVLAGVAAVALLISATITLFFAPGAAEPGPGSLLRGVAGVIACLMTLALAVRPRQETRLVALIFASAIFGARVNGMLEISPEIWHSALAALDLLPPIFIVLIAASLSVDDGPDEPRRGA